MSCVDWTGAISTDGYAQMWDRANHRTVGVHRVVLAEKLGRPIAPGMFALHTCDNRRCVPPDHIYEGTAKDNGRDMSARGRCRNGYTKFTLPRLDLGGGWHYLGSPEA